MVWAWPQLDYLAALLFAIGLCILIVAVVWAFYGVVHNTIGKLPIIGGWLDASSHHIAQRITSIIGGAAAKIEARIGASWHQVARIVDHLGREIARHAGLIAMIAQFLPGANALVDLWRLIHFLQARAKALERAIEGIGHDVIPRVKVIERGIGADVLPRIRSLERELHGVIARTIPGLRAGERTAEREITNLWKWTRKHTLVAGTAAFAGAVALALRRLGLDWIRCNSAKSVFKKRGCGLWNELDRLLAAFAEVALVTEICQVLPWLEKGFSLIAAPLIGTLTRIGAGLCNPGDQPPELLPAPGITLPAVVDATVYLP